MWYKPIIAAYPELTECHIDETLYYYDFHHAATVNQQTERVAFARKRYKCGGYVYRGVTGCVNVMRAPIIGTEPIAIVKLV